MEYGKNDEEKYSLRQQAFNRSVNQMPMPPLNNQTPSSSHSAHQM